MRESRRSRRKARFAYQTPAPNKNKAIPFFLIVSLFCLLIAHFNFNKFYWLFFIGLLGFSFTTAGLLLTLFEHFLPSGLVNHRLWTGEGIGGKGLAGLIAGILAIAIMVAIPFLLMKMGADYIK
jgi:hypothetical protein